MPNQPETLPPSNNNRREYFWQLLIGVWTILSIFMASQLVMQTKSGNNPIFWYNAFLFEWLYCLQWMSLAPITLWLAKKFPLNNKKFFFGIFLHLLAGTLFSSLTMGGRSVFNWAIIHHMDNPLTLDHIIANMTGALDYGIMSYILNTLFCYGYEFYNQMRERELRAIKLESELGQAQLMALKMQLHPHFFFNTLNVISVLIRKQENDLAVEMISRLSKFLRYTLDKTTTQEVSLREELNAIDLYLEIQKVRFQDNLILKRTISPDVLDSRVPTLILQPLIENALQHGISKRESGGVLELSAERVNGSVHIRISDNGPGISPNHADSQQYGIGLQNSESRLQKLYGSKSQFEIYPRPEGGTTVHLAIPYSEYEE